MDFDKGKGKTKEAQGEKDRQIFSKTMYEKEERDGVRLEKKSRSSMNMDLNNELAQPFSTSFSACSPLNKDLNYKLILPSKERTGSPEDSKERQTKDENESKDKACRSVSKNHSQEENSKMEITNSTNFFMIQKFPTKEVQSPTNPNSLKKPQNKHLQKPNKDANIQISQDPIEPDLTLPSNLLASPINIQDCK